MWCVIWSPPIFGAWANAGVPDPQTYDDHARGTFHILQACAELDVGRARAAFGYDPVFHWSETQQFPED
jgi:hypothetical protein